MIRDYRDLKCPLRHMPSIWLAPEEYPLLVKYANLAEDDIVEIGTAWGGSAAILVLCSSQHVVSIDPYEEPLRRVDGWDITPDGAREKVALACGPEYGRWTLWTVTSEYAANYYSKWTPKRKFGLVYIDGDHNYTAVRQDVNLWLPKIISGGYLLLHDSCRDANGVAGDEGPTQVAKELRRDPEVEEIDSAFSMTVWRVQ